MKIKFGSLILDEWDGYSHWEALFRSGNKRNSNGGMTAVVIVSAGSNDKYFVIFHNPKYLQSLFPYENPIFGSIEDVKQKVDRFLIQMSNMTSFI